MGGGGRSDGEVEGVLNDCLSADEIDAMHTFWGRVDAVLNDAGVQYWADSGTLIGAMRHEGVIPWDDDIDIALPAASRARLQAEQWRLEDEGFVLDWERGWPKIWHRDGRKIASHEHRWPFADLFFLEEREQKSQGYGARAPRTKALYYAGPAGPRWPEHCYLVSEVQPLMRVPFGHDEIWVPAQPHAVLDRQYPSWRETANSGDYDHRRERHKRAFEASFEDVLVAHRERFGRKMRWAL